MVLFVQVFAVTVVSQEQYEPKCKVNCKTTKILPFSCFTAGKLKSLYLIKCCLVKMCEGVEVALHIFNLHESVSGCFHTLATSLWGGDVQGRREPLVYFG